MVLWLAMHIEDLKDLFSGGKDPPGIFNSFDWFAGKGRVPDLCDYSTLEQDEVI